MTLTCSSLAAACSAERGWRCGAGGAQGHGERDVLELLADKLAEVFAYDWELMKDPVLSGLFSERKI